MREGNQPGLNRFDSVCGVHAPVPLGFMDEIREVIGDSRPVATPIGKLFPDEDPLCPASVPLEIWEAKGTIFSTVE
jgi:hypothetical protein